MKTVLFNTNEYQLVYYAFDNSTRLRITILKENYTIPDLADDLKNINSITIKEDDEVIAQYENFTNLMAINIYNDYPIDNERLDKVISIELENTNLAQQIQDLTNSVSQQQTSIDTLNEQVSELTPYTDTAKAYYNESEKTFYNVPDGNITVFFDNYSGEYNVNRVSDRVTVSFEPLTQDTNITISIN